MPKRTEAYLEERREHLVAAAYRCFLRNGYHATSIADVCKEADVTVGTIYKYFSSKRDIFLATQQDRMTVYAARGAVGSWAEFKEQYTRLALHLDQPEVRAQYRISLELNIDALFDEELARSWEPDIVRTDEQLAGDLRALAAAGEIGLPLGAETTARLLRALAFDFAVHRAWRPSRSLEEIAAEMSRTLDALVGAPAAPLAKPSID